MDTLSIYDMPHLLFRKLLEINCKLLASQDVEKLKIVGCLIFNKLLTSPATYREENNRNGRIQIL